MDLEDVVHTPSVLYEVARQNELFDLFEFFDDGKSSSRSDGACGFISRNQSFYCFSHKYHSLVFENVGGSLYDNGSNDLNEYYKVFIPYYDNNSAGRDYSNDAWRFANGDFGLVSIQMLSKSECFVWVPEVINSFQKRKLLEFLKEMKKINEYLKSNGYSEINVLVSVMKNHEFYNIDTESFIKEIDNYVDDNCFCPYERMLSDYQVSKHI